MAYGKVANPSTFTSSKVEEGDYFYGFNHEDNCVYYQQVDLHQNPLENGLFLKMRENGSLIRVSKAVFLDKKREMFGDEDVEGLVVHACIFEKGAMKIIGLTTLRGGFKDVAQHVRFNVFQHDSIKNKLWAIGSYKVGVKTYVYTVYETPQSYGQMIMYAKPFDSDSEAEDYIIKKSTEKTTKKGYLLRLAGAKFNVLASNFEP